MKKKKSIKKWIILGVVLLVIIAVVVLFLTMRANLANQAKTTYEIVDVEKDMIEVKVKGAGAVEPLVDETTYASFAGTVSEVFAEDGDVVGEGDAIVVFTSDVMETERDAIEQQIEDVDTAIGTMRAVEGSDKVRSPIEAIVKILYAEEGDNVDVVVDTYGALAVLCPDELMQTTLAIADGAAVGDEVTVTVGEQSADGEVYSVDLEADEMVVHFEDDDYAVGVSVVVNAEDGAALGEGTMQIANPVYISARGGVVERVYEDVGDEVRRFGKLFRLDGEILSAELYEQIETRKDLEDDLSEVLADLEELTVFAGENGVVSGLSLNPEQIVQEGTPLFTIESNDRIKVDVEIDELDIANISLGQAAEVEFDALPGKTYPASVVRINPIGVSVNNVTNFTITLEIEPTSEILLGMSADVKIVSQMVESVLIIPIEAIQIIDGEKFVVFEADIDEELTSTPATHKIKTGVTDGVMIEVTAGLKQGDRIAVPQERQLSAQDFMMGGGARNGGGDDDTPFE